MGWSAFQPQGNSYAISVTTSASAAIQAPGLAGGSNYLISNATTQGVFIAFGPTSTVAAVAPTAGSPANGIWLQGGSTQSFTFGTGSWFSAIAPTGVSTLYITNGDGL